MPPLRAECRRFRHARSSSHDDGGPPDGSAFPSDWRRGRAQQRQRGSHDRVNGHCRIAAVPTPTTSVTDRSLPRPQHRIGQRLLTTVRQQPGIHACLEKTATLGHIPRPGRPLGVTPRNQDQRAGTHSACRCNVASNSGDTRAFAHALLSYSHQMEGPLHSMAGSSRTLDEHAIVVTLLCSWLSA